MLAGPLYVTVSLAQAATRDGFDLTRHAWSPLANGPHGWIQITDLVLAGATVLAFRRRAPPVHDRRARGHAGAALAGGLWREPCRRRGVPRRSAATC
jgi:hypothetical protein